MGSILQYIIAVVMLHYNYTRLPTVILFSCPQGSLGTRLGKSSERGSHGNANRALRQLIHGLLCENGTEKPSNIMNILPLCFLVEASTAQ